MPTRTARDRRRGGAGGCRPPRVEHHGHPNILFVPRPSSPRKWGSTYRSHPNTGLDSRVHGDDACRPSRSGQKNPHPRHPRNSPKSTTGPSSPRKRGSTGRSHLSTDLGSRFRGNDDGQASAAADRQGSKSLPRVKHAPASNGLQSAHAADNR